MAVVLACHSLFSYVGFCGGFSDLGEAPAGVCAGVDGRGDADDDAPVRVGSLGGGGAGLLGVTMPLRARFTLSGVVPSAHQLLVS